MSGPEGQHAHSVPPSASLSQCDLGPSPSLQTLHALNCMQVISVLTVSTSLKVLSQIKERQHRLQLSQSPCLRPCPCAFVPTAECESETPFCR